MKESNKKRKNTTTTKGRTFTFLVYPESAPEAWVNSLDMTHLKIAISPIHDRDFDMYTGEILKEHFHVIVAFPNSTTENVAQEVSDLVGGSKVEKVRDVKGMYCYLTHRFNPEKAQYEEEDVQLLNGFDPIDFGVNALSDRVGMQKDVYDIIRCKEIRTYSALADYLMETEDDVLLDYISKNAYMIERYIHGRGFVPTHAMEETLQIYKNIMDNRFIRLEKKVDELAEGSQMVEPESGPLLEDDDLPMYLS